MKIADILQVSGGSKAVGRIEVAPLSGITSAPCLPRSFGMRTIPYELGETVRRAFSPFTFSRRHFSLNGLLFRKIESRTEVETVTPTRACSSLEIVFVPKLIN